MRYKNLIYAAIFCTIAVLPALSFGTSYKIEGPERCGIAQFSGEGEDFSLDCAIHLCPFDAASAGTKLYEKLTILRQVREKILKPSKRGRRYVALMGQHGAELAKIVLEDPNLAEEVRNITKILIPIGKDLLAGDMENDSSLLDEEDAVKLKILSIKFEEKASADLKKEIIKLRFELDEYVDKSAKEILALIHGFSPQREARKIKESIPKLLPIN